MSAPAESIQGILAGLAAEWGCDVSQLADDPHSVWGELVEMGLAEDSEGGFAWVCRLLGAEVGY